MKKNGEKSVWSVKDVLLIIVANIFLTYVTLYYMRQLYSNNWSLRLISRVVVPIPTLIVVYIWYKVKGIRKKDIGFCLPMSKVLYSTLVAISLAVIISVIDSTLFFSALNDLNWSKFNFIVAALFPFTFGIEPVIISPLTEEIVYRGIVYGYLLRKLDWKIGLILQALLHASLHIGIYHHEFSVFIMYFFTSLILGFLYKFYRSLYPSFLCHSIDNYLGYALGSIS